MSETWVINGNPNISFGQTTFSAVFTSNNTSYSNIVLINVGQAGTIKYNETQVAIYDSIRERYVWTDQSYRTVTFDEPVTGNLLTWFNSPALDGVSPNAVKQAPTKITLDLSTLNLPEGTHSIQMSLSGSGKRDSELSEAVEYTVEPAGETWVINETPTLSALNQSVSFVSNNTDYTTIEIITEMGPYDYRGIYYSSTTQYIQVYRRDSAVWTNQAYRTVTFNEPPTGDLLIWLQSNAVKQ